MGQRHSTAGVTVYLFRRRWRRRSPSIPACRPRAWRSGLRERMTAPLVNTDGFRSAACGSIRSSTRDFASGFSLSIRRARAWRSTSSDAAFASDGRQCRRQQSGRRGAARRRRGRRQRRRRYAAAQSRLSMSRHGTGNNRTIRTHRRRRRPTGNSTFCSRATTSRSGSACTRSLGPFTSIRSASS